MGKYQHQQPQPNGHVGARIRRHAIAGLALPHALLTALLTAPLATSAHAAPDDATLAPDVLKKIQQIRKQHQVPAVGLALVDTHGTLWSGALGVEDIRTGKAAGEHTRFRIGSITKTFTGIAMLQLQERGLAGLDDRIREHVPDALFTNAWADTHPITVAHVLEHTAGFNDMLKVEWDHNDATPVDLASAMKIAPHSRTAQWPPGTHSSYSNSGAGLAALVLEAVTDQSYEQWMQSEVFAPLSMHGSGFFLDSLTQARLATGYDRDAKSVIPYWHMIFRVFGGINTTPADMANFVRMLQNRGALTSTAAAAAGDDAAGQMHQHLLSAASIRRLEQPHTTAAAQTGLSYGYGLGNYAWVRDGFVFHGHGGDGDGYLAHYGYNREIGKGYFVVINVFRHAPLRELRALLERHLIGQQAPPAMVASAQVPAQALQALTGSYREATQRFAGNTGDSMQITAKNGRLYTRYPGRKARALIPVSAHHFRRAEEPVATAAFSPGADGQMILQGDMGNYVRIKPTTHE